MKMPDLKKRMQRNRPMTTVTLRMPEDTVEELKRIAPLLGFSGYQPLIRNYIGQSLRSDIERMENAPMARFVEALKHNGVSDEAIQKAIDEIAA